MTKSLSLVLFCLAALVAVPAHAIENRCGWLVNPTPGNLWLDDSEGTWILLSQGMPDEALGMENIPDFSVREFVKTNGNYGYGCACLKVDTEEMDGIQRIVAVYSYKQLKLAVCRRDASLPDPE